MKIVKGEIKYKDEEVYTSDFNLTYVQNGDSNDSGDVQELKMSVENAGGGDYYILETRRWASNNIQELIDVLTHFKNVADDL